MNKKSKKFALSITLIILLLALAGVFYWWQNQSRGVESFFINNTEEGKIVVNKKEGLKVKVPNEWNADKFETISSSQWGVNLSSADIVFDANYNLEKGCMIEVNIEESNLNFEITNKRIQGFDEKNKPTLEKEGYEIIEIDQKQAVKEIIYDNDEIGIEINLRIPIEKDKNIYFVLHSSFNDKEICFREFDRFLETIKIE